MLISDLSYLETAETSIVGGFYLDVDFKKNKINVVVQDAKAKAYGASEYGNVYVKANASNYAYAYNG